MNTTTADLEATITGLADASLTDQQAALWQVAQAAERAGASTVLVDVLLDSSAPAVARRRALGRIGARLLREEATPAWVLHDYPRHLATALR